MRASSLQKYYSVLMHDYKPQNHRTLVGTASHWNTRLKPQSTPSWMTRL